MTLQRYILLNIIGVMYYPFFCSISRFYVEEHINNNLAAGNLLSNPNGRTQTNRLCRLHILYKFGVYPDLYGVQFKSNIGSLSLQAKA